MCALKLQSNEKIQEDFSDISNDFVTTIESRHLKHQKSISNFYPRVNYYFSEDGIDDDISKSELPKSSEGTPTKTNLYGRLSVGKNFTIVSHLVSDELTEIKSEEEDAASPGFPFLMGRRVSARNYLNVSDQFQDRFKQDAVNRYSVRFSSDTKLN